MSCAYRSDKSPKTEHEARRLIGRLRDTYARLWRWREEQRKKPNFTTPLGRRLRLPSADYEDGRPKLPSLIAGIAQAYESDALRAVVALAASRLGGLGVEIVLLMHDGLLFEVPEENADAASRTIEKLMLDALQPVCGAVPAAVDVETRKTWGRP